MKKLVIIGAGGFAREVAWLVEDINSEKKEWDLMGFIDENTDNHGKKLNGYPVLGSFDVIEKTVLGEKVYAVCAVGNPRIKMALVDKSLKKGLVFTNLIHPKVNISVNVTKGVGNIICAGNVLTVNITVQNHVIINLNCTVGHDVIINNYSTIAPGVNISGNVLINDGCDIGTSASIIQGVTIGSWSTVGAGAVVVRDIPPCCTAVGVPAIPIKFNS